VTGSVSVVIPVHNGMRYLERAVASALEQSEVAEVIVVDDEAPEPVPDSVRASHLVRVVSQARSGPGAARNTGVRLAKQELVAFLDADDEWLPNKLGLQLVRLRAGGAAYSTTAFRYVVEHGVLLSEQASHAMEREQHGEIPSTLVLRRDAFFRVGPFAENLKTAEDVEWFLRAQKQRLCQYRVDEVLVLKRLWRGGLTSSASGALGDLFKVLRASLRAATPRVS